MFMLLTHSHILLNSYSIQSLTYTQPNFLSFLLTNRLNKLNTHLFLNLSSCTNCTHNNDSMKTSQITINICLISLNNNKQYGHIYDNYLHRGCTWRHRRYVLYKPIVWRGKKYQKVIFESFIDSAIYNDIYG